jgi:hypothetical protein
MATVFIAYDADNAGRLIGKARMNDSPEELARVSSTIDKGNELFNSWALEHGGRMISCGGDEGILEVPMIALNDLNLAIEKYKSALELTVSVGVGRKMSESFKALLAAKLRGKNRTTIFDKDVEKEIKEASDSEEDEKKKLVDEYLVKYEKLEKRAPIHHTGKMGRVGISEGHFQEQDMSPEIQQKRALRNMPEPPEESTPKFKQKFTEIADKHHKAQQAKQVQTSDNMSQLKEKIADALQKMQNQLPVLQQIKQASPETYDAVLSVVNSLVLIGKQVVKTDQELTKAQLDIPRFDPQMPARGMQSTSTGNLQSYDLGMDKTDLIPGGEADYMAPEQFDQEQLAVGTQHELEHTDSIDIAREIAMDHLMEDPDYYKKLNKKDLPADKEELDPNKQIPSENVLDKNAIDSAAKGIVNTKNLIPGQSVSSRHIVVQNPSGKSVIKQVASGMQRDNNDGAGNPIGPGMGNPISSKANT